MPLPPLDILGLMADLRAIIAKKAEAVRVAADELNRAEWECRHWTHLRMLRTELDFRREWWANEIELYEVVRQWAVRLVDRND